MHSIWPRFAGFVFGFVATSLIVTGVIIAAVGLFGAVLVRMRPDTQQNITYDPSTVTLIAPIPILAGMAVAYFAWRWKGRRR